MIELSAQAHQHYRHDALLYSGIDGFVRGTVPFIRDGIKAGEPVLVATSGEKIDALRRELGPDAQEVIFADMALIGANPARIIPFWAEFIDRHKAEGRAMRGIGEPIWAGRGPAELVECQRHESLLNVAVSQETPMWLLCPYDTESLEAEVIREALHSHPYVTEGRSHASASRGPQRNGDFRGVERSGAPFEAPLPPPPAGCHEFPFGPGDLTHIRELVSASAYGAGLDPSRAEDLVVAAHEVAANSLRHGGGRGYVSVWRDGDRLICEVRDQGRIDEPLVDRVRPGARAAARRGLWLANQLCDLVQIRSLKSGSVVRLHMHC